MSTWRGDGAAIFRHACKLGCEEIISKQANFAVPVRPKRGTGSRSRARLPLTPRRSGRRTGTIGNPDAV